MTYHDRSTTWFLAQLKPNCDHIAQRNLTRLGFLNFLPREETTKRVKDHFITALRPLFPGYIFVAFNAAMGHWRTVNSTFGITRLVSFGQQPSSVPLGIVSQLLLRCDAAGVLLPPKRLQPGDQVCLTTGPFANFVAEIETIAPDRRIWVLMDFMGGRTRVLVDPDQLRLA